jgi:5-methyltetrahydrofolate--homocysteine methyltransferase
MDDLKQLYNGIIEGKAKPVRAATEAALAAGIDPNTRLNNYMIPAMDVVGEKYEAGEYFVPELLMAARAMKGSLELLRPLLTASGVAPVARVAIGTVKGDLHDIGKNLVAAMLEGGGFEVIDLGVDVPAEKFISAIRDQNANIVAMSALLTTTMGSMKGVVESIQTAGLRSKAKVIIGGAPITDRFAAEIGADGYSPNASGAVGLARKLLGLS